MITRGRRQVVFGTLMLVAVAAGAVQAVIAQGRANFPQQQRPPGDPAVIARGRGFYGVPCTGCHGPDLRGGDQGGPNLLRSEIVLTDEKGEEIGDGHPERPSGRDRHDARAPTCPTPTCSRSPNTFTA